MTDLEIFKKWRIETLAYPGELIEEINGILGTEYKNESEVSEKDWKTVMDISIAVGTYDLDYLQDVEWLKAQPHYDHLVYELPDNFPVHEYKDIEFGKGLDLAAILKNIFIGNCVLNYREDEAVGFINDIRTCAYLSCSKSMVVVRSSNTWPIDWPDSVIFNLLGVERNNRQVLNVKDEDDEIIINVYVSDNGYVRFSFYTTEKKEK
jgi:hypothetical protein